MFDYTKEIIRCRQWKGRQDNTQKTNDKQDKQWTIKH
jgi:hypothetical protein